MFESNRLNRERLLIKTAELIIRLSGSTADSVFITLIFPHQCRRQRCTERVNITHQVDFSIAAAPAAIMPHIQRMSGVPPI